MKDKALKSIYSILKKFAVRVIKRHKPFVIAVTGSVGKTSTKEAVYYLLKEAYGKNVRATAGNLNAEIGIPLTILGYKNYPSKWLWPIFIVGAFFRSFVTHYPKYLILEMGVDKPGDIKYFGSIVRPDIAIITAATPAHTANFLTLQRMQEEKISIRNILIDKGLLIVNMDDEFLAKQKYSNVIGYSIKSESNYKAEKINISLEGNAYQIDQGRGKLRVKSNLVGRQMIYNELAAIAVAFSLNIKEEKIKKGLLRLHQYPGRVQILPGINGSVIIDDSYNSNPASAKAALNLLKELKEKGRKVAILGNMNELGKLEEKEHRELGYYAKDKCDIALFVGPNAENMKSSFANQKKSKTFLGRTELQKYLKNFVCKNDIILVKASQNGNYFEEVVKFLMKEKNKSDELLVRQSKEWMFKKQEK